MSVTEARWVTTYTAKVCVVVNSSHTADFTEADWLQLALAALDQAGVSVELQMKVLEQVQRDPSVLRRGLLDFSEVVP